jgi:hypothetical protein
MEVSGNKKQLTLSRAALQSRRRKKTPRKARRFLRAGKI